MAAPSDSPKILLPSILAGLGTFLLVVGILHHPPRHRAWQQRKHLHHGHRRRHRL